MTAQPLRHEAEVDTRIAETYTAWMLALGRVQSESTSLHYACGHRQPYKGEPWRSRLGERVTLNDAITYLEEHGDVRILSYGKTGNEILAKFYEDSRRLLIMPSSSTTRPSWITKDGLVSSWSPAATSTLR